MKNKLLEIINLLLNDIFINAVNKKLRSLCSSLSIENLRNKNLSFFAKDCKFNLFILSIFLGLFLLLAYKLPIIIIMNNSGAFKLFYILICLFCSVVAFCLKREILSGNKVAQYSRGDFLKVISASLFLLIVVSFLKLDQFYYNLFSSVSGIFSVFIPKISLHCSNFGKGLWDVFNPIKPKQYTLLCDGGSPSDHRLYEGRIVTIVEDRGRNPSTNPNSNEGRGINSQRRSLSPFSRRSYPPTVNPTQVSGSIANPSQVPRTLPSIQSILGDVIAPYGRGLGDVSYTIPMDDRRPSTRVINGIPQVYSYTQGWVNRYMEDRGTYMWSSKYNDYFPYRSNVGSGVMLEPGDTKYRIGLHWDGHNYRFAVLRYTSIHTGFILYDGVPRQTYNIVQSLDRYCDPPY